MGLKFVFGRSGYGKSTYCLNEIKNKIKDKEINKVIMLVPEQLTFSFENMLLNTIEKDEDFKAEVLSFKTLSNRIFNEVGGLSHRNINSSGRAMLIYNILLSLKKSLNVFSKASVKMGLIPEMSSLIKELKTFNIESSDIEEVILNIENESLKDKLADIAKIFDKFNEKLHTSYIDEEDELKFLSEKIVESNYFINSEVFVDGFENMNPIQLNVLEEVIKKAKNVTITITSDGDSKLKDSFDIFNTSKNFEESLLDIVYKNNIKYEKPINLNKVENKNRFSKSNELSHIEKYAFKFPFEKYKKETNDIEIFTSSNLYSEVEWVAKNIISLVRDNGYKYSDITVSARNIDKYEGLIEGIFLENNISVYIDKKKNALQNPIINLLLSSIEVEKKRWSYEGVFTYLKSGLIDLENDEINLLENYVVKNGIKGKRWFEEFKTYSSSNIDRDIKNKEIEELNKINNIRENAISPIKNFHDKIKASENVRDMCREVYDFLLSIGVDKKISDIIDEFNEKGEIALAREYAQVFDVLIEVLDQLVELIGDEKLSLSDFFEILSSGFNECKIGAIPSTIDSVSIVGIDRMKTESNKVLFIIGVNDGVFPSPIINEGIINDVERGELKLLGMKIDIDTKEKSLNEQFLIYSILTSASEKLFISYPVSDHDGKTLRQSIIVHRLKKIFPKIKQNSNLIDIEDSNIENITTENPTFNILTLKLRNYYDGEDINTLWLDVFRWFKENNKSKIDRVLEGLNYTNQVKKLPEYKAKELYKNKRYSISQIETYSKCPYSYFIKYGLKANERREFGFRSLEIGSFMHKVLEEFSDVLEKERESLREISKEWIEEAVNVIVDNMLKSLPDYIINSSSRYKFLGERLKRLIVNAVWIITKHINAGEFEAIGYEEGFGRGEKFPPIIIKLESGEEVEIIGKIDRLDEANLDNRKYIRIVDYKSSKKKINLSDIYHGLQIQLLVYLDAILENYKTNKEEAYPGGVFYFKLDEPILSTEGDLSNKDVEEKMLEEFKMEGLLLKDMKLALAMDSNLTSKSKIIPVTLKKDGEFSATTNGITEKEFYSVRKYIKNLIKNTCSKMLNGNIDINPYKEGEDTPCTWCEYSSICQFDINFPKNNYNKIKNMKKEIALEKITKEVESIE